MTDQRSPEEPFRFPWEDDETSQPTAAQPATPQSPAQPQVPAQPQAPTTPPAAQPAATVAPQTPVAPQAPSAAEPVAPVVQNPLAAPLRRPSTPPVEDPQAAVAAAQAAAEAAAAQLAAAQAAAAEAAARATALAQAAAQTAQQPPQAAAQPSPPQLIEPPTVQNPLLAQPQQPVAPQQPTPYTTAAQHAPVAQNPVPAPQPTPRSAADLEATQAFHPFFANELNGLDPAAAAATAASPTTPVSAAAATQALGFTAPLDSASATAGSAPETSATPTQQTDALNALFGENNFVEYEEKLIPVSAEPVAATADAPVVVHEVPKKLLWSGLGIVVALLTVAAFLVGMRLPAMLAPADEEDPGIGEEVVDPIRPLGPVAPGEHHYSELLGGECVAEFTDAWQDYYTVVDCATPHAAQLLATGEYESLAFPGDYQLRVVAEQRCQSPEILDFELAKQYTDVQISVSYPMNAMQWEKEGTRHFYNCFASLASGAPMTTSISGSTFIPSPTAEVEVEGDEDTEDSAAR